MQVEFELTDVPADVRRVHVVVELDRDEPDRTDPNWIKWPGSVQRVGNTGITVRYLADGTVELVEPSGADPEHAQHRLDPELREGNTGPEPGQPPRIADPVEDPQTRDVRGPMGLDRTPAHPNAVDASRFDHVWTEPDPNAVGGAEDLGPRDLMTPQPGAQAWRPEPDKSASTYGADRMTDEADRQITDQRRDQDGY